MVFPFRYVGILCQYKPILFQKHPRIAKDLGLEDEQVGDVGGGDGVGHGGYNKRWLFSAAGMANQGGVCSGPFGHGGFAGCPALVLLKL